MQSCSTAYKEEMHEQLREHGYIQVSIGVVNQAAQSGAAFKSDLAYYSDSKKPFNDYVVSESELYALTDNDYTPADGSMYFLPRKKSDVVLNNGAASEDVLGAITIVFDQAYDIKGLTIEFGRAYPKDFTITSDNHTQTVTGNDSGHFVTDDIFSDATYLTITPTEMAHGSGRLHIHQITMGVGIIFTERQIKTTTKKEHISPVAEDLQTIDFSCTIDNQSRDFDIENETSTVNFLEVGQQVELVYYQELMDGTIEAIKGSALQLKEWSANDTEMSFTAVDRFDDLDNTYYGGYYSKEGRSLYDLALDIFKTAGVDERTYEIDSYLKSVIVNNPIPVVSYKEALQLIANAGRSVLYQDRDGKIVLKSNFVPDVSAIVPDSGISSNSASYFSVPEKILKQTTKETYGLTSKDYIKADAKAYFLPRKTEPAAEYKETGYISNKASGADGTFEENPELTLQLEADYKTFGITFEFGINYPAELALHVYNDDELQETITVLPDAAKYTLDHEFPEFDRLDIEFVKTPPYNVAILNNITFGDATDYDLSYGRELTSTPEGTQLSKVKTLQFTRTIYNETTEEEKELTKETVTAESAGTLHTFYFNNASYDLRVSVEGLTNGQSAEIVAHSDFYAQVKLAGLSGAVEVSVIGKEYVASSSASSMELNTTGKTEKWSNPLVSTASHADDMLEWLGDYLKSDREYNLSYRGEPRIDGNDVMFLENKYVDKLLIRVYEHTLSFNGAYSGSIKARRDMSYVANAKNKLASK